MRAQFWGIDYLWWGLICLVVAAIWGYFWPVDQVAVQSGWRFLLIRWGHALVWLFLALSCFARTNAALNTTALPNGLALLGLACYVLFLFAMFFK